jgi:hypothetical protein
MPELRGQAEIMKGNELVEKNEMTRFGREGERLVWCVV